MIRLLCRLALPLILALVVLSGCSRTRPEIIPSKTMVMSFTQPDTFEPGYTLHGWWFVSRDQRRTGNMGKIYADQLSRFLDEQEAVTVYPRLDLRYYLDAKKLLLAEMYPALSTDQVDQLFNQIDPLTFARDRGCDILVIGEITDIYVVHNRFIHFWQGVIRGEVRMIDVRSGEEIWRYYFKERDLFRSQAAMCEKIAKRVAKKAHKAGAFN